MSYQWTDADRRFQREVDDMVQDQAPEDLPGLARDVEEGRTILGAEQAARVAHELRARAASGLLFRPLPKLGDMEQPLDLDDEIPW